MPRIRNAKLALAGCLAAVCCACAGPAAVASPAADASGAPAATLSAAQQRYLALARAGVARAERRWRDRRLGWYDSRLGDRERYPLATIWDAVPLFQSLDAIALADPSVADRRAVERFAAGAERYLNRGLRPLPGYSPYPGDREAGTQTWFDDNGWWGLAFVEAYRATSKRRYLADAQRALDYIAAAGWDPRGGGIWWNTEHPYKSGPALASDTLLAALLYQQTHDAEDLRLARMFLTWGREKLFSEEQGLYMDSNINPTPIDYVESPLMYARALLCRIAAPEPECTGVQALKAAALRRFGSTLNFSPQYDAVYLQWLLALYALEGDPALYRLAATNAADAQRHAANGEGLYLLSWAGQALPAVDARPGMLQTHAATTSLFAWLAAYAPPAP